MSKLLLGIFSLVPAALGALLSLAFKTEPIHFSEKWRWLEKYEPAIRFFIGVCIAYFVGNGFVHYRGITDQFVADSIKFICGIFGMALFTQGMIQIPLWMTAFREKILSK